MKKLRLTIITLCLLMGYWSLSAQKAINSAGGELQGSAGSGSFSVGQFAYKVYSGSNGSITHGVQNPWEISVVAGFENENIRLDFFAFPNPTTDRLTLSISEFKQSLTGDLFDLNGTRLKSFNLDKQANGLDLRDLKSSVYFLKISHKGAQLKTFKIIKK